MKNTKYRVTSAGVKMPKIIYGTAWKKEKTTQFVIEAIKSGFSGIDTACQPKHYSEGSVGDALKILTNEGYRREDLYIQTKFTPLGGQDPNNIPYDKDSALDVQVAQSFKVSQKNLQTDYVDSLVLHSPLFPYSNLLKVYRAMEQIQKDGGALQLGISNCYDLQVLKKLYKDAEIKPAVVQNRFYNESNYDKELRLWCDENGVLYQSFWTLTANPNILSSETIFNLARKYKKSEAQIFFNYLSFCGITPLSGTTSEIHMLEDIDAFNFELTEQECYSIAQLI